MFTKQCFYQLATNVTDCHVQQRHLQFVVNYFELHVTPNCKCNPHHSHSLNYAHSCELLSQLTSLSDSSQFTVPFPFHVPVPLPAQPSVNRNVSATSYCYCYFVLEQPASSVGIALSQLTLHWHCIGLHSTNGIECS